MATKTLEKNENEVVLDTLTTAVPHKQEEDDGPRVSVFLPELEDSGTEGIKIDQYEHVTIANEEKEQTYWIHRGEWVEVPVPVFVLLKDRYPKL